MGCGTSSMVKIEISSFSSSPDITEFNDLSVVSGVYSIHSGALSHTLVLYNDGKVVIDGKYAESIVYKHGRREFTFRMYAGGSLTRGEVRFSDTKHINGVFYGTDHNSYVIKGALDEDEEIEAVKAEGEGSFVIDQLTLKRYKKLEVQLEKYNSKDMYRTTLDMTGRAKAMELSIKTKVESIENMKEKLKHVIQEQGAESAEAKELEIELESKCLALAEDQREYDRTLKYIKNNTADLFDYNILSEEFDQLLHVMFGGDNGSDIENQLEQQVDELETARRQHEQSFDRHEHIWEQAKGCCNLVLQSLNTWSSLQREDLEEKKKLFLAKQTRSFLVSLVDCLVDTEMLLQDEDGFISDVECREKAVSFKNNIYEMYKIPELVQEGIDILMFLKTQSRTLEQWVYENFKLEKKHTESKNINSEILAAKLNLKDERRNLIQNWLTEHVGELEKGERDEGHEHGEISSDEQDRVSLKAMSPFDIQTTYAQIVTDLKLREQRTELDGIRAQLDLQDKIRTRRKRQRHRNAQKLLESTVVQS